MRLEVGDVRVQRLCIAAAISVAVHLATVFSIGRGLAGDNPFADRGAAPTLIARLRTAEPQSPAIPEAAGKQPAIASTVPVPAEPETAIPEPSRGVANPGDLYYFKSSELDRRPFPLERIEIPPPESPAALTASVMLRLRISESGQVDDVSIVMSTGLAEFEAAALDTFAQASFHPGYRANRPVRSEMLIEVTLEPPPPASAGAPVNPQR